MPAATPGFVHLHVHSSYSLLEGALTIARLAELAKKDRQPALALTDTDNMFGALEFSEKMAGAGIQPIIGCALGDRLRRSGACAGRAAGQGFAAHRAACRARAGLPQPDAALLRAPISKRRPTEQPHIKLAVARRRGGRLDRAHRRAGRSARRRDRRRPKRACRSRAATALQRLFGDRLYVELQRHGMAAERIAEPALIELAYARGLPLVATNEPFFAARDDYEAHDALLCIAEGRLIADGDRRQLTPEHRFKTRAEMAALFADLPEALAATVEIARRCAFRPRTLAPILPRFSPERGRSEADDRPKPPTPRLRCRRSEELRQARERLGAPARAASARARPHGRGLSRAARLRARRHRADEISPATS